LQFPAVGGRQIRTVALGGQAEVGEVLGDQVGGDVPGELLRMRPKVSRLEGYTAGGAFPLLIGCPACVQKSKKLGVGLGFL